MHIGTRIQQVMKEQGRSVSWLAEKLPCERTNVYYIYKRSSIDTELLFNISKLLNHDFFSEISKELPLKK